MRRRKGLPAKPATRYHGYFLPSMTHTATARILKAVNVLIVVVLAAALAAFIGGLCRHRLHGRHRRPQSGETPQVLSGRGEQELVLRAAWTAQSQTPKL